MLIGHWIAFIVAAAIVVSIYTVIKDRPVDPDWSRWKMPRKGK